jgi:hypothetical protein
METRVLVWYTALWEMGIITKRIIYATSRNKKGCGGGM